MDIKNTCRTCKHYFQHYIKDGIGFRAIHCDHCRDLKKKTPKDFCPKWEDATELKQENIQTLKKTLQSISQRLDEIAIILINDQSP